MAMQITPSLPVAGWPAASGLEIWIGALTWFAVAVGRQAARAGGKAWWKSIGHAYLKLGVGGSR